MVTTKKDPWEIAEVDFPASGSISEKLQFVLGYAILAPSGHNTQPWAFNINDDTVSLYADRNRALPVVDPKDRELIISCGASLYYLRLAIRCFGYQDEVVLLPSSEGMDLLAQVRLGSSRAPTVDERELFNSILTRRTNRQAFATRAIPLELLEQLQDDVASEGGVLRIITDEKEKGRVADLIAEGDLRQMNNPDFREELAHWIRRGHGPSHDGMPGYAFGVSEKLDFMTPVAALMMRRFNMGKGQAAKDHELATGSSALAVISGREDAPKTWLEVGQALAKMLLRAESKGLKASYLNQPIEEAMLRTQIRHVLMLDGVPQLLLRLGYGPELDAPTPRRSVAEVLRD